MVEAQLALTVDLGLLDVHVETEGAAVHLRRPDGDEIADGLLDRAFPGGGKKLGEFLEKFRGLLGVVDARPRYFLRSCVGRRFGGAVRKIPLKLVEVDRSKKMPRSAEPSHQAMGPYIRSGGAGSSRRLGGGLGSHTSWISMRCG